MGVKIVETSLRDGHQSLFATRMTTEEVVNVAKELDDAGYYALEVWGGATFDSCLRFLNEDPWERLREVRKVCKKTKLQMLFRGQNILGYRHYSDDVVDMFVKKSIENGIDIIRVFDALNDIRNLQQAVKSCKKYGGHCQIALSYTTSPVHTVEYYVELAKKVEELGADSLCIKDMAGVLLPEDAKKLFKSFDIDTVDAFQGKECDVVLVNTVVTDASQRNFLNDFRRINVSMSRSRDKLIVFGNRITLSKINMKIRMTPSGGILRPSTNALSELMIPHIDRVLE